MCLKDSEKGGKGGKSEKRETGVGRKFSLQFNRQNKKTLLKRVFFVICYPANFKTPADAVDVWLFYFFADNTRRSTLMRSTNKVQASRITTIKPA